MQAKKSSNTHILKVAWKMLSAADSEIEKRMLQLFLLLRVLMLGFFVALYSGYLIGERVEIASDLRMFFFLVTLASLVQLILLHAAKSTKVVAFVQLSLDIVLLTYVLSITETTSSFTLYVLVIICASLVTNSFSSLMLSAFAGICYAVLISDYFGDSSRGVEPGIGEILISYLLLVSAALIAGYYARGREKMLRSIKDQSNEIQNLTNQQIQLMNSMAEGVITLDIDSAITGINDAAKSILGLAAYSQESLIGVQLDSALHSIGESSASVSSTIHSNGSCEMRLKNSNDSESVLKCTAMDMPGSSGDSGGKLVFLSDVSELKNIENRLEFHEKMSRLISELELIQKFDEEGTSILIGKSVGMQTIQTMIKRIAPSDAPVLLLGESGTGKEVVAKALHNASERSKKSFVPVNCGAIPESLIESEFFGYMKGAFTGADKDSPGLFREADNGTLFLDEVGELPLHLQAKLLRVLQERVVRPVGGTKELPVNVRIIAATNRDLKEEVKKGTFREDLYYRLKVVEIEIPPLRDRKEDIPLLIAHFLEQGGYAEKHSSKVSPEALSCLMKYSYPGNIRELENILSRGLVLGGGVVLPENLPDEVKEASSKGVYVKSETTSAKLSLESLENILFPVDIEKILSDLERKYLLEALAKTSGAKKEAAKILGLNFRSFRYRLKKFNIDSEDTL